MKTSKYKPDREFLYWLKFDLKYENQRNLIYELKFKEVPCIDKLSLWNLSYWDDEIINNFIEFSIPYGQQSLSLNFESDEVMHASKYLDSLSPKMSHITTRIEFYNFRFNNIEFEQIVFQGSHLKAIVFEKWIICTDTELDFSNISNSKLSELSFEKSGDDMHSQWTTNFERFNNILHGITTSKSLLSSLKRINISSWGINKRQGNQLRKDYSLGRIQFQY